MSQVEGPWDPAGAGRRVHAILLGGALVLGAGYLYFHHWSFQTSEDWQISQRDYLYFSLAMSFATLAIFFLVRSARTAPVTCLLILLVAAVFRLILALDEPVFARDLYRYHWDGAVLAAGENPYAFSPDQITELAALDADMRGVHADRLFPYLELEPERADSLLKIVQIARDRSHPASVSFEEIHYRKIPTVYPPVSQYVFALPQVLGFRSLRALRVTIALFDLGTVILVMALLARLGLPPVAAILYAWHPLPIKEFADSGHHDAIAIFLMLLALHWTLRGRWLLPFLALAAATAAKIYPVVLAPIFYVYIARRQSGLRAAVGAVAGTSLLMLLYAPFVWDVGLARVMEGFRVYAGRWTYLGSVHWLILKILDSLGAETLYPLGDAFQITLSRAIAGVLLLGVVGAAAWKLTRTPRGLAAAVLAGTAGVMLTSPALFPWYFAALLPYLCLVPELPLLYLTTLAGLWYLKEVKVTGGEEVHISALWVRPLAYIPVYVGIVLSALSKDSPIRRFLTEDPESFLAPALVHAPSPAPTGPAAVIIPCYNEEQAIGSVLAEIPDGVVRDRIVVNNGSTDRSAEVAREAGATVADEPRRGYGRACLAGIAALAGDVEVVVFLDGDHSDYPEDMTAIVRPIREGRADLVIGSRTLGEREAGALLPQAYYGNKLAAWLVWLVTGRRITDLGPFRAIRRDALNAIGMIDTNFGWTVEMQLKAIRARLRVVEVPVRYRKRLGASKITGTLSGTVRAGAKIIYAIFRHGLGAAGKGLGSDP